MSPLGSRRGLPFWPFTIAVILILIGLMEWSRQGEDFSNVAAWYQDTLGRPMDWPGEEIPCRECGKDMHCVRRWYHYECRSCGVRMSVRFNSETGKYAAERE